MTVGELCGLDGFELICEGDTNRAVKSVYCGDLLSSVMLKAPEDCAWVTVMGNINAAAVSFSVKAACIVLAESAEADREMLVKTREYGINLIKTDLSVFEAALRIYDRINSQHGALLCGSKRPVSYLI